MRKNPEDKNSAPKSTDRILLQLMAQYSTIKRTVGMTGLAACPDVRPDFIGLYVKAETHLTQGEQFIPR